MNKVTKVKIVLDSSNTMEYCDKTCIPALKSSYNDLFSEGMQIKLTNIHYTYCINEKGVMMTSRYFGETAESYEDYGLYLDSVQLSIIFKKEFESQWMNI